MIELTTPQKIVAAGQWSLLLPPSGHPIISQSAIQAGPKSRVWTGEESELRALAATLPAPVPTAPLADQMAAAWAQLPQEIQDAYENLRKAINAQLRSGLPNARALARLAVEAQEVTPEQQPYKDAMLALLA